MSSVTRSLPVYVVGLATGVALARSSSISKRVGILVASVLGLHALQREDVQKSLLIGGGAAVGLGGCLWVMNGLPKYVID